MKEKVIAHIQQTLQEKINHLQGEMAELQVALEGETKSTSGDKHETSRAMVQREIQNLGDSLQNWNKMQGLAGTLKAKDCSSVELGALLTTETNMFFISVALGKISVDKQEIFCLAPTSPLAQKLMGKKKGETVEFNRNRHLIKELF